MVLSNLVAMCKSSEQHFKEVSRKSTSDSFVFEIEVEAEAYLSLDSLDDDSAFLHEELDIGLRRHPCQFPCKSRMQLTLRATHLQPFH